MLPSGAKEGCVRHVIRETYPNAPKVRVGLDTPNTHPKASPYETLPDA